MTSAIDIVFVIGIERNDCMSEEKLLKELEEQERALQFTQFTSETVLEVGLRFVEKAKKENKSITIDITRNGHQLFHYSFTGTSPDNDRWVARKNNVVNRFNKSSLHVGMLLKLKEKSIEEEFLISSYEYAPYGGAFPIIIKDVGVVGTIAISGLTQEEDHEMIVKVIKEYLGI